MELPEDKCIASELIQGEEKERWPLDDSHTIRHFTEDDIERITSKYSTPIGKGGFGEVYRGVLDDDYDLVAVKKYIRGDLREEFVEEVRIHSQINHKNIVKLIGYCIGDNTLMIVTKYISKGNLDDILHNSNVSIPLDTRLGIAIGCAEALSYMHLMHLSSDSLVCHGDIKPANILLDDNLIAKVSDFGLSRLLSGGITRYTRNVKGSIDYMDPVYLRDGLLTRKNDVYSFGAVLLELITRKRVKEGNISLIGTFSKYSAKGKWSKQLFDAGIANNGNMKALKEIGKLATDCLTFDIGKRPEMKDVSERLRMIWKDLQGGQNIISWGSFRRAKTTVKGNEQDTSMVSCSSVPYPINTSGIFSRNGSSEILANLGNVIFTKEQLNEITQGYSYLIEKCFLSRVYKGTLEDNTLVAVKKYPKPKKWTRKFVIREAILQSQLVHENIIKILGCCLQVDVPALVYEYFDKGTLYDILHCGNEFFPLESRLKIAVKTAEALAHVHSSGLDYAILHCRFTSSTILLDGNFTPKVSDFTLFSRVLAMDNFRINACVESEDMDPLSRKRGKLMAKTDLYSFGIVLLELISRKKQSYDGDYSLVDGFIEAYEADNSGKAMFDKDITAEEDIIVLEEIGRLAVRCISLDVDERPAMSEVAESLEMLRRSWKNAIEAARVGELEGTAVDVSVNAAKDTKPGYASRYKH